MKNILPIILLLTCLVSCKTTNKPVKIKISESNGEVTLFYSKKMNAIWSISLPFNIEITNPTSQKKGFRNYKYRYHNALKGKAMKMYLIKKEKLSKLSVSKIKYIDEKSSQKYLITSKHFIDTTTLNKIFFKPYLEKMKNLNQDTLNVGTISQFKLKHKNFVDQLIKNDSISFLFLNEKSKSGFKRETLSVEY